MPHLCPWWAAPILRNPLRSLLQDPASILSPLVREGMTVLEPGPGTGFFTVEMARRVGERGKVVAVDVQEPMLRLLRGRLEKEGVLARVETRLARRESLGVRDLEGGVDFALLVGVLHEVPDRGRFLGEILACLRPGGALLLAEPRLHVRERSFRGFLRLAEEAGFKAEPAPPVPTCRAVLLRKT